MTKVVHLTTVHQALDVRIFHKEATSLAAAGFNVVLIAPADAATMINQVRILPLAPSRNRWERMTRIAWLAYRTALVHDADVYHFHDPELIVVGMFLKLHGKHVIYDAHEDFGKDIQDKAYLPRWSKPVLRAGVKVLEFIAGRTFDQIIAATSSIEQKFPKRNVTLVRNVPILNELAAPNAKSFSVRPRNVVYIGGLAPFNGIEQMVRAMDMLPKDAHIRLILGGVFSSTLAERAIRGLRGWKNVDYLGRVSRERIANVYAQARAGLVVYQPTPNIMECEPNKFLEVLSAGLPLIASDLPHWRRFIEQHSCGTVVSPSDPESIASAIFRLVNQPAYAEEMGRNGQRVVLEHYNWNIDGARLLALYDRLLSRPTCNPMSA